jgi:spermidine/putrescine transport system substrate-binding protein
MRKNILSPLLILSTPICLVLSLTTCVGGGMIVLANFESYMHSDLIDKFDEQVNFLYYQTNEEIESKYKRYYDLVIPSTYEVITFIICIFYLLIIN